MRDHERLNRPVIVPLPAEIDIANADVGEQLRAAFAPGVTAVTPKWAGGLCCTSGSRQLVAAHKRAMNWPINPEREIGDCRRSHHVRQIAEAFRRASRRPV